LEKGFKRPAGAGFHQLFSLTVQNPANSGQESFRDNRRPSRRRPIVPIWCTGGWVPSVQSAKNPALYIPGIFPWQVFARQRPLGRLSSWDAIFKGFDLDRGDNPSVRLRIKQRRYGRGIYRHHGYQKD